MFTPKETSPYNLLQEHLRDDPWKLLVACIMLNMTTAVQVKKVIWNFFKRWPNAESLDQNPILFEDEMKEMIRPLGFKNRRFDRIVKMSFDYQVLQVWKNIEEIDKVYGVGKYAADSFRIFVGGYIVEDVLDKELRNYVQWVKEKYGTAVQPAGIVHSGHAPSVERRP